MGSGLNLGSVIGDVSKAYVDLEDTTVSGSLKTYVDSQGTSISGALKTYSDNKIIAGTQDDRPAAGQAGRLYLPTDGYYPARDTGSVWVPQPQLGNSYQVTNPPVYNDADWTQIHFALSAGTTSILADGDGLLLKQTGNNSTSARDSSWLVRAIPVSGAYSLTVGMEILLMSTPWTWAGICLTDGNGGTPKAVAYTIVLRANDEHGQRLEYTYETNPTTLGGTEVYNQVPAGLMGGRFYLRITDDRSSFISFWYSMDGRLWMPAWTGISRTGFAAGGPAYAGLAIGQQGKSGGGGYAVPIATTRSYMKVFHWSLTQP